MAGCNDLWTGVFLRWQIRDIVRNCPDTRPEYPGVCRDASMWHPLLLAEDGIFHRLMDVVRWVLHNDDWHGVSQCRLVHQAGLSGIGNVRRRIPAGAGLHYGTNWNP